MGDLWIFRFYISAVLKVWFLDRSITLQFGNTTKHPYHLHMYTPPESKTPGVGCVLTKSKRQLSTTHSRLRALTCQIGLPPSRPLQRQLLPMSEEHGEAAIS